MSRVKWSMKITNVKTKLALLAIVIMTVLLMMSYNDLGAFLDSMTK